MDSGLRRNDGGGDGGEGGATAGLGWMATRFFTAFRMTCGGRYAAFRMTCGGQGGREGGGMDSGLRRNDGGGEKEGGGPFGPPPLGFPLGLWLPG